MSTQTSTLDTLSSQPGSSSSVFVTLTIADQLCGIPVAAVRDILREQPITWIPLAPPEVAGSLNLRGRIVTAIDLRKRLALPPAPTGSHPMSVVTEHEGEFYALLVDRVCDVLNPDPNCFEENLLTLPQVWAQYCAGVYRLDSKLLLLLNLKKLLAFTAVNSRLGTV